MVQIPNLITLLILRTEDSRLISVMFNSQITLCSNNIQLTTFHCFQKHSIPFQEPKIQFSLNVFPRTLYLLCSCHSATVNNILRYWQQSFSVEHNPLLEKSTCSSSTINNFHQLFHLQYTSLFGQQFSVFLVIHVKLFLFCMSLDDLRD